MTTQMIDEYPATQPCQEGATPATRELVSRSGVREIGVTESATLDVIDLSGAEQAVYEYVVAAGQTGLDELTPHLGLSPAQLQPIVAALVGKGLLNFVPGRADRLAAAPPDVALEALLLAKEERIKRARLMVQQLADKHEHGNLAGDLGRCLEVITGRDVVLQRAMQMQRACCDEVRVIDKPPYFSPTAESAVDVEQELLDRGVRWRGIYDTAGLESFHRLTGDVEAVVKAGEVARVMADAPIKMLLFDDRMGMLPLHGPEESMESAVVVHPSVLLDALSALFEELWGRAFPLRLPDEQFTESQDGPSAEDLRLLGLLTAGLTDETIARHLKVSHRTMQRRLRSLLDRLGARTRFQAALRAAALGWLPIDAVAAKPVANGDRSVVERAEHSYAGDIHYA